MPIYLEMINLLVKKEALFKKGLFTEELTEAIMSGSVQADEHLVRFGAMNPLSIRVYIDEMKRQGLKVFRRKNGRKVWGDLCVISTLEDPADAIPCEWLEIEGDGRIARMKADR